MKTPIYIAVAAHKAYEFPEDAGYRPLHVGSEQSVNPLPIDADNSGEHISSLNKYFCELTGIYWMWKNVDADIYGLAHYRRYFSALDNGITLKNQRIATTSSLCRLLDTHDVVISKPRNYWIESVRKHYANAHKVEDLEIIEHILRNDYPEYLDAYDRTMNTTSISLYNMFVMKSEHFKRYCQWLFDILLKAKQDIPYETYGPYQRRVFGFLAERLLNVWINHNIPAKRIKHCKVVNIEGENIFKKAIGLLERKLKGIKQA
ncbi:DUF4422 domain-containing protein [Pseudomonas citronellolis]|uniref:DUF4422 domain-containing protein n=1 Tax=Pseudomonas citronellolis TaxID=53408 RepID=UPI0021C14162|nr:DUF4422 domain-containing protein [Pseudomonas citronellolis]MDN6871702.1 DUF4422 domain-containing protein [Pseudomonas citronellolis]UXJ54174.1 DUF4422 domain-containing protein [Pseudomonas citronellolis]